MKNVIKLVCVILAVMMLVVCFAGCGGSHSSGSHSSGSSNSGGFVGSDGEYHSYIPEFGDDVNNWMAENW